LNSDRFVLPKEGPLRRTRPFLITCEGYGDARFVSALLIHKQIEIYDVGCPTQARGFGDGKDAIPQFLKAVASEKKGLRGVLIMADANDSPQKAFDQMVLALQSAEFPTPSKPFHVEDGDIRAGIYLVPGQDKKGSLENLLLDAALNKNPAVERCLSDFSECTGSVKSWPPNQQAKMRLAALVAAFCEENPSCSPAWVWGQKGNPIPIESECFNDLTDFMNRFSS